MSFVVRVLSFLLTLWAVKLAALLTLLVAGAVITTFSDPPPLTLTGLCLALLGATGVILAPHLPAVIDVLRADDDN